MWKPQSSTPGRAPRNVSKEDLEAIYARNPDPWNYRNSTYEHEKYAATEAALPEPRYRRAFDVGCSIGVLTERLAKRCDQLLAVDVVEAALDQARTTCAQATNVTFARLRVPGEWPDGRFDLILISEVLCYLDPSDVRRTAAACLQSLEPRGTIVLVNFLERYKANRYADEMVPLFCEALRRSCKVIVAQRTERYRIDLLRAVQ